MVRSTQTTSQWNSIGWYSRGWGHGKIDSLGGKQFGTAKGSGRRGYYGPTSRKQWRGTWTHYVKKAKDGRATNLGDYLPCHQDESGGKNSNKSANYSFPYAHFMWQTNTMCWQESNQLANGNFS
jgi:hypothetical protein